MNSSLKKALVASLLAVGGAVTAVGQGWDFDAHCIDPNNTAPYSNPFNSYMLETPWFAAGIGVTGTCTYKYCTLSTSTSASIATTGRLMLSSGPVGSIQDDLRIAAVTDPSTGQLTGDPLTVPDNGERYSWAANTGDDPIEPAFGLSSGAGWSFARVQQGTGSWLFGSDGFYEAFIGRSNRYMYVETNHSGIDIILTIDVLGDTARTYYEMQNKTTTPTKLGLWFAHYIELTGGALLNTAIPNPTFPAADLPGNVGDYGEVNDTYTDILEFWPDEQGLGYLNGVGLYQPYIIVPGLKPIETEMRFTATANPTQFPAYCDFSGGTLNVLTGSTITQARPPGQAYGGLQVVNQPIPDVEDANGQSDQTPTDEFVIGDMENEINGISGTNSNPTIPDEILPDAPLGNGFYPADVCFVQKWYPTSVPAFSTRSIISYYRNIWGDSSYSDGYTAVVDTPKVLSTSTTNPAQLDPNPFTIQVDVDNTGGFGQVYKEVSMSNVQVILQLPQGLSEVGNPANQTLTSYINSIKPASFGTVQFQVQADPTVSGLLPYTVTIIPTPGATKTITGILNVASTPVMLLRQGANLVTCPWNLENTTWESVLSPLQPELDYTAFSWDPTQQAYIISTTPERGEGTWIVCNSDHGVVALGGDPTTPTDEFPPSTGAPNINLAPGWNLVGNPYNYSFPIGQLVGVAGGTGGTGQAQTYDELVSSGVWDGSFAYYIQDNQSYNYLDANTDRLLPGYGYWVYVNQPLTISFPPVFDLFVRGGDQTKPFVNYVNHWKLQLVSQTANSSDGATYVGLSDVPADTKMIRKPPISPAKNAIRTFVSSAGGTVPFAQVMHGGAGRQTYTYGVYSKTAGPVTVTWPNLRSLPSNLDVEIKDLTTGKTTNARTTAGINFEGAALGTRQFQVQITPLGTVRETIGNVSTTIRNTGSTKQMTITYDLSSRGLASVFVYQGSKQVGTVIVNQQTVAGNNSVVWPLTLSNGLLAQSGNYTLEIKALGEGGDTATKLVNLSL